MNFFDMAFGLVVVFAALEAWDMWLHRRRK